MQQHPVPQNVTQYQFRLVGDMTLKQFLELAAGLVLAYLFYASNLIFIIKWPFALLSLFLGIALAFFPIEERPLDVWIINFLRSIYAPTRFIWTKTTKLPALFTFKPHEVVERVTATKTVKAPPLPTKSTPASDLSAEELDKIKGLESLLSKLEQTAPRSEAKTPSVAQKSVVGQKPTVQVRQLSPAKVVFDASSAFGKPTPLPHRKEESVPEIKEPKEVIIPTSPAVALAEEGSQPNTTSQTPSADSPAPIFVSTPTSSKQAIETSGSAENIHLPAAPKKANLVVGMVVDQAGHLVDNAIVQITTQDGVPARAIKTNSLGQFYISTPLTKGDYAIEIEKDGLTFTPQALSTEDKLIPPLLLRAN